MNPIRAIRSGSIALAAAVMALALTTSQATAQDVRPSAFVEARGGLNVPTFDIADVAEAGPSFGFGVGVPLSERIYLMADADFGSHDGEDGGLDVNVNHYMGKVGVELLDRSASRWSLMVNAGAGAMTFDVDAPGTDSETYFAINVGAKIAYQVGSNLSVFLSPQGDIAFSDEDFVGTGDSWVWPFAAGIRVGF